MPRIRKNYVCQDVSCTTRPYFNLPGETKGMYCATHATEGMVDVKHNKCEYPDCDARPRFNIPEETKGIYCVAHATEGMVNVEDKKCEHPNCNTRPGYNFPEMKRGRFCSDHALEGMVDVKHNKCEYPDCNVRPSFNILGETKGMYCVAHATEGMVDVVSKTCQDPDCLTQPHFNLPGEKIPIFCVLHKTEEMIDTRAKPCDSCGLRYRYLTKGLCVTCNPEAQKRALRKEQIVEILLRETFQELSFIRDKSSLDIKTCTGTYLRPDFVLTLDDRVIIVECDEHQHKSYTEQCEVTRMVNISMSFNGLPIFFIRYNPDGKCPKKQKQAALCQSIRDTLITEPTGILHAEYLFYDSDREHMFQTLIQRTGIDAY
jgi:EsV-1-7 cysteine-rich motif